MSQARCCQEVVEEVSKEVESGAQLVHPTCEQPIAVTASAQGTRQQLQGTETRGCS